MVSRDYDVIVVGAGINGAAIARDAALRGYRVLLLEQGDLCNGTSSWSSRLIHGGLRYLEYGELPLVYESLHERQRLLRLAPHLVQPLALNIPIYAAGRRPRWKIKTGLLLYDLLAGRHGLAGHQMLSAAALLASEPGVNPRGLIAGARYYDAQIRYPERLVVAQVTDAAAHGARIETRAKVRRLMVDGGRVRGVRYQRADEGSYRDAVAPAVINAAGPWLDELLEDVTGRPLLGGTKGSHIIVPPWPNAPRRGFYSEARSDGRPFFILPWNGMYLIGTTDIRYQGDPSAVSISDCELDYLLSETGHIFPGAGLSRASVAYCYAGVRPLPHRPAGVEGAITRRHIIKHHKRVARGLFSIIGGKLTTHRNLAEQAVDRVQRLLGGGGRCVTRQRPLPGCADDRARDGFLEEAGARLSPAVAHHLWALYGAGGQQILARVAAAPELADRLGNASPAVTAELIHGLEQEWAVDLIDLLQRRTMVGLDADFGLSAAGAACAALTRLSIWDHQRATAELEAYRRYAARFRARALAGPLTSA